VTVEVQSAPSTTIKSLDARIQIDQGGASTVLHLPATNGRVPLPGKFIIITPDIVTRVTVELSGLDSTGALVGTSNSVTTRPHQNVDLSIFVGAESADGGAVDFASPGDGGCLPIENCFNDLDDDCDGVINNGCPDHIALGTPRLLTVRGGPGGSPFSVRCPSDSYVIKSDIFEDATNKWITGVTIYCAAPTLIRGSSSYSVMLTPVSSTPSYKGSATTGLIGTSDCGTSGFVAGWGITGKSETNGLDALGMVCANGGVAFSASNQLTFSFTANGTGANFVADPSHGTAFEDDCAPGEALIGYDGGSSSSPYWVQAVCAPLVVVYK
jgi:hypothetical protein